MEEFRYTVEKLTESVVYLFLKFVSSSPHSQMGFDNKGGSCFFNAALQCLKPAFLKAVEKIDLTEEHHIIKKLHNLYTKPTNNSLGTLFEHLKQEAEFKSFADLGFFYDDSVNVLRQFIYFFENNCPLLFDEFVIKVNPVDTVCTKCQLETNPTQESLVICNNKDILSGSMEAIEGLITCPRCQEFVNNITFPHFLLVRCNKKITQCGDKVLSFQLPNHQATYHILSLIISNNYHATCYACHENTWYYFDDGSTSTVQKEKIENFNLESGSILGAIYIKQ